MLLVLLQREVISSSKVAVLPTTYQTLPAQAVEYSLACAQLPKDVSHTGPFVWSSIASAVVVVITVRSHNWSARQRHHRLQGVV